MRTSLLAFATLALLGAEAEAAPKKRPFAPSDVNKIAEVADPQISADGNWVAYTVSKHDMDDDEVDDDVWLTSWDGAVSLRMTTSKKGESSPRLSPDGKKLAFLSDRDSDEDEELDQIYLMNRAGGEAEAITEVEGEIEDFLWSPDGKKIAVVMKDRDPNLPTPGAADKEKEKKKTPRPIVLDRYQ